MLGADTWWTSTATAALQQLAATGRPFTAAALADLGVPPADHPTRLGALIASFVNRGQLECVGATVVWRDSTSRALRVWCGTPAARATPPGSAE